MKRREILLLVLGSAIVLFAYEQWQDTRLQRSVTPDFNRYTLIEPGLYVGGNASALPPDVSAVLCLTVKEDSLPRPR